jgi:hypothetical protein
VEEASLAETAEEVEEASLAATEAAAWAAAWAAKKWVVQCNLIRKYFPEAP